MSYRGVEIVTPKEVECCLTVLYSIEINRRAEFLVDLPGEIDTL